MKPVFFFIYEQTHLCIRYFILELKINFYLSSMEFPYDKGFLRLSKVRSSLAAACLFSDRIKFAYIQLQSSLPITKVMIYVSKRLCWKIYCNWAFSIYKGTWGNSIYLLILKFLFFFYNNLPRFSFSKQFYYLNRIYLSHRFVLN